MFGCTPHPQHREGISRENPGPGQERVGRDKKWMVSLYSNGVSLKDCTSRELPGVRNERVVGLDNHGSPSKELRQDNEKD